MPIDKLILIRHAQAALGAANYDQLTDLGWEQARALGAALHQQGVRPDHVITGGMRRQLETATGLGFTSPTSIDPGFVEIDMFGLMKRAASADPELAGDPSGQGPNHQLDQQTGDQSDPQIDRQQFGANLARALRLWAEGKINGAESWSEYCLRVQQALLRASTLEGTVFIVTSGGAIAAALAEALSLGIRAHIDLFLRLRNCSLTEMIPTRSGLRPLAINALPFVTTAQNERLISYV